MLHSKRFYLLGENLNWIQKVIQFIPVINAQNVHFNGDAMFSHN